jgi:surface polysaccharide O-acyltransferase-like enzyme
VEISKNDTKVLKGIAIMLMLLLHLFARKEVNGLYEALPTLNGVPFLYYLVLLGDDCRPIYLFLSGYAFYIIVNKQNDSILIKNLKRIVKLMINYWIVFLLFVPLAFVIGKTDRFSNINQNELFLNILGFSNSYNGAWWFLKIYIIIVLFSPILINLVKKFNYLTLIFISGTIYFLSYIQRFKEIIAFGDNEVVLMIINTLVLLGTSQFSFMIGSIFAKEKVYSKIHQRFHNIKYKNFLCIVGIFSLIVIHTFIESAIIAPLNGIMFIIFFTLMNKSNPIKNTLTFLSNHSTNIWLTHMFFYMTIFPELTFAPKYPVLIYIWLLALCIVSSYLIKSIYDPIISLLDKKKMIKTKENKAVG